jgi:hypothetical protein
MKSRGARATRAGLRRLSDSPCVALSYPVLEYKPDQLESAANFAAYFADT